MPVAGCQMPVAGAGCRCRLPVDKECILCVKKGVKPAQLVAGDMDLLKTPKRRG